MLASLLMYAAPKPVAAANAAFWAVLPTALADYGVADLPYALSTDIAHDEACIGRIWFSLRPAVIPICGRSGARSAWWLRPAIPMKAAKGPFPAVS